MKKIFTTTLFAVALMTATPSQAQVSFGLKGGLNITNMSLSQDVVSKSNRAGFFIGPSVKFTLPLVGLGIDAAALYDQRGGKLADGEEEKTITQHSINIPINIRYGIGLGSMASVYLAAGPQFGFNVGDSEFKWNETNSYNLKKTNFSINVGAGVSLISHLEVGFTYNIALGKTADITVLDAAKEAYQQTKSRSNSWQISLAYYF